MSLVWKMVHSIQALSLKFDILSYQQKNSFKGGSPPSCQKNRVFKPILQASSNLGDEIPFKGGRL